jgi:hypothetical protein
MMQVSMELKEIYKMDFLLELLEFKTYGYQEVLNLVMKHIQLIIISLLN